MFTHSAQIERHGRLPPFSESVRQRPEVDNCSARKILYLSIIKEAAIQLFSG